MAKEMHVKLQSDVETIKKKFKSLKDFEDIADLFEIPSKELRKILIVNKNSNYTTFKMKKKNRDYRVIHSPKKNLSILQKKFSFILSLVYNNHFSAHGFISKRSIKTNANLHLKQKHILNFDLETYFESIKFPRVRAMFMSYFGFNDVVATTLANICCHYKGFLPQGASTSPAISNIISYKLDKDLYKIAKKYHCTYSRYADDITFSTRKSQFPINVAYTKDFETHLGSEIVKAVKSNGFFINDNKTRLKNVHSRLSVNGITVNEKLNIDRKYIRKIRSILHCIEKNRDDIDKAILIFNEKYNFRQTNSIDKPDMFDVLRGMISYVGFIKGKEDPVYLKLAMRFNKCIVGRDKAFIRLSFVKSLFQETNTYVIPSLYYPFTYQGESGESLTGQGTGFVLKGIGLVTNYHVLKEYIETEEMGFKHNREHIIIHRSKYSAMKQYAKLLCYDKNKDIAILEIINFEIDKYGFDYNCSITTGQEIQLIGYPDFKENMDISIKSGEILGERTTGIGNHIRYEISAQIFGGNSGGPVVNINNEVVAIAVKGAGVVPNEVIPITQAIELAKKKI